MRDSRRNRQAVAPQGCDAKIFGLQPDSRRRNFSCRRNCRRRISHAIAFRAIEMRYPSSGDLPDTVSFNAEEFAWRKCLRASNPAASSDANVAIGDSIDRACRRDAMVRSPFAAQGPDAAESHRIAAMSFMIGFVLFRPCAFARRRNLFDGPRFVRQFALDRTGSD